MKNICCLFLSVFIFFPMISEAFPKWLPNPYAVYSKNNYEAAVGEGSAKKDAEAQAYVNLSMIFGTEVTLDARAQQRYIENAGVTAEHRSMEETISVAAEHDLINARIGDSFFDSNANRYHAVAVLHKEETSRILSQLITENVFEISELLERAEYETDLFYRFSFLDMAAIIAKKTESYSNQYAVLNNGVFLDVPYKYRVIKSKADAVARLITYGVETENPNSTIQMAIESALSGLRIRISKNPEYIFKEKIIYEGTSTGYGMYILQYTLLIDLVDTNGTVITSFSFKGKEGGINEQDALRVLRSKLGKEVSNSFAQQFSAFLNSLAK